jgi:hypothetical protein
MSDVILDGFDRVTECFKFCSGIDKVPKDILDKASERGTAVHDEIQAIQSNLWIPGLAEHAGYINSYKLWAQEKKFIDNPGRLYDLDLKLTGELDALYKMDENTYCLVDFKTTAPKVGAQLKKFKRIWGMQLAAYALLATQTGLKIERLELIQLDKTGKEPLVFDLTAEAEENLELYFKCLDVYREFFKGKTPEDDDYSWI